MDTKRTKSKSKTLSEPDSETRTTNNQTDNEDTSSTLKSLSSSSGELSSSKKPRGRPVKKQTVPLDSSVRKYPLSLAKAAIEIYQSTSLSVIECYVRARSKQIDQYVCSQKKTGSIPISFLGYFHGKKQVKFMGIPNEGDLLFLKHGSDEVALVHAFHEKEGRMYIWTRDEHETAMISEVKSWFGFASVNE